MLAPDGDLEALGPGRGAGPVNGLGDDAVDVHGHELGQRLPALQPGEVDELAYQAAQPVGLVGDPAGEALDGVRVVGGLLDRLGKEGQGTDGGLQLVPDIRDEVPADRLRTAGLGDVLQHERDRTGRRRGSAVQPDAVHTHEPGPGADQVPGQPDVEATTAAGTDGPGHDEQVGDEQAGAAHDAHRAGGGVRQEHRVVHVDDDHGRVHQVQEPSGEGGFGQGDDARVRACYRIVPETEEGRGGHRPAEEEADHQRDQRTHAPMLGRPGPETAVLGGETARRGQCSPRRGRPFTH